MSRVSKDKKVFIPDGQASSMIFLPVVVRALESKKRNSLLTDHKAVEILDRISDPHRFLVREESLRYYAIICKTLGFDRLLRDFIWRHPNGTVINIGCGLDSAFERLHPEKIYWYDLDLPEIIRLRKFFFRESEYRKHLSASFLSDDWTSAVRYDEALLIYASDVFYHYDEETIRKFIAKISIAFPAFEIIFNITSPAGVKVANRLINRKGTDEECLKWGLVDFRSVLSWNPRMRFLGKYSIFHQSFRIPFRFMVSGLLCDVLSLENIVHFRIRYDYNKLSISGLH